MLDKTPLIVGSTVWETSFSKIRTRRTKQTCLGKEAFVPQNPGFEWGCSTETLILSKTIFFVAQILHFVYEHHLHFFNLELMNFLEV